MLPGLGNDLTTSPCQLALRDHVPIAFSNLCPPWLTVTEHHEACAR
jgi:hypothetical protein